MERDSRHILLSIIIPVYNVKFYLRACVKSVIQQGDFHGLYEILLINDGSTDGSDLLCDQLAGYYAFIHVYHQKHAGLGAARNTGIRNAVGEYLLFLDADDFIGKHTLVRLFKGIWNQCADVYFLNSYKYFGKGRLQAMSDNRLREVDSLCKNDCMKLFAQLEKYPGSACDKAVRRCMVITHGIFFEEGVVGEDLVWVLKCLLYAQDFQYLEIDYYFYRQNRPGSITSCCDASRYMDQIHVLRQGVALAQTPKGKCYQKEIYTMMAYEAEVALLFWGMLSKEERMRIELDGDMLMLLKYRNTGRTKFIRRLIRKIGAEKTAHILGCGYFVLQKCLANGYKKGVSGDEKAAYCKKGK